MLAERGLERREAAAEIVTGALVQSIGEAERWLVNDDLPDGVVRLTRSPEGGEVSPVGRVLWVPDPRPEREAASAPFADAERAEFADTGDRGVARYQALARSTDSAVRAGSLIRLARVHRRDGRIDQALQTYRTLAHLQGIAVHRTPIDLIARRMICEILAGAGRKDDLAREAAELSRDLHNQRWRLDRAGWELSAADIAKWTGASPATPERQSLSEAVDWVYAQWRQLPPGGRRTVIVNGSPVTMLWQTNGPALRAVVVTASVLDGWLRAALARDMPVAIEVSLVTESGRFVAGSSPEPGARVISRHQSETGLPWSILVGPGHLSPVDAELVARRRLLAAGVAALVLLLAGSSYLMWRIVQRELAIARLQTDFVAAVSHEFRTPLTSLRHISDLLQESDELPAGRRQSLYSVLGQSTERLHRLVESLLDFARMEDGRKPWNLRPTDVPSLVTEVVASFRKEHEGVAIHVDAPTHGSVGVEADRDALTHALWNLLDNAVKYSPAGGDIRVSVQHDTRGVAISVADHGLGIPSWEHKEIFQRFVRGRQATEQGIAGTGLGLAMVSHIAHAHGGRVDVDSEEGHGSTFTLVLPTASTLLDAAPHTQPTVYDGRQP